MRPLSPRRQHDARLSSAILMSCVSVRPPSPSAFALAVDPDSDDVLAVVDDAEPDDAKSDAEGPDE